MSQFPALFEEEGEEKKNAVPRKTAIAESQTRRRGKKKGKDRAPKDASSLYQSYIRRMLISPPPKKGKIDHTQTSPPLGLRFKMLVSFQPTSNQFQAPMRYICKTLT